MSQPGSEFPQSGADPSANQTPYAGTPASIVEPRDASTRPWFKKKRFIIPIAAVIAIAVIPKGGDKGDDDAAASSPTSAASQEAAEDPTQDAAAAEASAKAAEEAAAEASAKAAAEASAKAEEERVAEEKRAAEEAAEAERKAAEEAARGTVAQQNAYDKAGDYLAYMAFSRSGLIEQLEFEGYATGDAEFAVKRLENEKKVDWNEQAAAKAKEYLDSMPFSRSGLIEQLVFEGFTQAQAEHGVGTTGL